MTLMCQMGRQSSSQNPFCTEQPNSNDEMDLRGVKADQQLLPLNCKQCNSNRVLEPCDMEDKKFPLSLSYKRQPHSVGAGLSNMGNTCFVNATLQYITHTVPLSLKLCSTDHSTPCLCMGNFW